MEKRKGPDEGAAETHTSTPPEAYGWPSQHAQQHPSPHEPPAVPAVHDHGWGAPPETFGTGAGDPGRGDVRSTVLLVVVALIVALGAGGSVFALLNGGGDEPGPGDAKAPATSAHTAPGSSAAPTKSAGAAADGAIPEEFLGTWKGAIDNASGHSTRRLTLRQGAVGDTVLSLVADGPAGDSTYHCVFEAALTGDPHAGRLEIGPSRVTTGEPASSCTPGAASEITLLPDGRLRRVNKDSDEALTYTKGD
ncbi:hypothetical protein [Streptomyces sp. V3I7]|uniref:hypothetical protein n=1 Tax=Streptomyces sp. V3I7 TaxID=3042278 RepID=UPI002780FB7E|nr:hypothetical protein [Streptomyces sp. V3I7]MDQ0992077.1 hypothetical protein [Streptomyces sp. V3I7]